MNRSINFSLKKEITLKIYEISFFRQKQGTATEFSTVETGQVFFDFKHFADPEETVLEYINTYIYKR